MNSGRTRSSIQITTSAINVRVASSILVKVDNFYDGQHQLTVYDNDDCTGDIVESLNNNNGCLSLFSLDDGRVEGRYKSSQNPR